MSMHWENAAMQAIEELTKSHKEYSVPFLALMLRAGQLTTDTHTREEAIQSAVEFEREQCAKVAWSAVRNAAEKMDHSDECALMADFAESAIRARKDGAG